MTPARGSRRDVEPTAGSNAPLARCEGWWEQDYFGRQEMDDLRIAFDGRKLRGAGVDVVGAFTLEGTVSEAGAVAIVKQYVGRHQVDYFGRSDGEGTFSGVWRIGELGGRWTIKIGRLESSSSAPIHDLVPPG